MTPGYQLGSMRIGQNSEGRNNRHTIRKNNGNKLEFGNDSFILNVFITKKNTILSDFFPQSKQVKKIHFTIIIYYFTKLKATLLVN